jgi:hypothetical protein
MFALLEILSGYAWSEESATKRFGVAPLLGVYSPSLRLLNQGEFEAPLPGQGRIIFQSTGENINYQFMVNNTLEDIDYGTEAGVEFKLLLTQRDALLFGISSWEGVTTAVMQTELPFQGVLSPAGYERSGRFSYSQYFLGWEHALTERTGRFRLNGRVTLNEVFDIDYKEDLVFGFQGGPAETFKRLVVMESQATGVLMLQLGLGAEYFARDWVSFGFDAGYSFSPRSFQLGSARLKTDIQPDDNIDLKLPLQVDEKGILYYLADAKSFDDVTYRRLDVSLDGWRALFRVNFYF